VVIAATVVVAAGAIGAAVGFAVPASAGSSDFTAAIIAPANVTSDSSDIEFGGQKSASSTINGIYVQNGENFEYLQPSSGENGCDYGDNASTWRCFFFPGEAGFEDSNTNTIEIDVTGADGTYTPHILNFDVTEGGENENAADTGYAEHSLSWAPGQVSITGVPYSDRDVTDFVGMDLAQQSEGGFDKDCPSAYDGSFGDDSSNHFGGRGPQSCTFTTPHYASENDDGGAAYTLYTLEASNGEGPQAAEFSSNEWFYVYPAPTITAVADAGNGKVLVTGTGALGSGDDDGGPLSKINVYDGTTKVCGVEPSGTSWNCTTSALALGTHTLAASVIDWGAGLNDFDADASGYYLPGGMSELGNAKTITFAAPVVVGTATPTATPTPTPTPSPLVWGFTINGINVNDMRPGQHFTITGSGLPGGTTVSAIIHSKPESLGSTTVASDGTFTLATKVPNDLPAGAHTIILTATGSGITTGGSEQQGVKLAKVKHKSVTPPVVVTTATSPTAPNILTKGLQPFSDIAAHPNKIISAVEIGLVLLLLAAFPAHLLESTIAEQSERFERRFKNRPKQPAWITRMIAWFRRAPVAGGILVTAATAIIFGFADPTFGFTLASLRLLLAAAIALFLVGYVANALTGFIARVAWKVEAEIHTRPWGLILTVVGVILSRLLHFAPGFLIGLILGLAIEGRSAAGYAWRLVVTRASIVIVMAILAWTGYSLLTLNGTEGGTFGSMLLVETLVAITTEGIVALLVELLPLRFLEGERIYAKSRILWGVFYVLTILVFVIAIVPWEGNWSALGSSLWIWIGVLVLFALICIGVYVYFRRFAKPLEEEPGSEEVALGETVSGDNS
jgi:hypothetical protein